MLFTSSVYIIILSSFCAAAAWAAAPQADDYYKDIDPDSLNFKWDLSRLISQHKSLSYNDIWGEFEDLDTHAELMPGCTKNGTIGDVYSSKCWLMSEKCGNYKRKGTALTER